MKISIDFDGTLWSHMEFFREFMAAMQDYGHEVGMLTAHNEDMRETDLALLELRKFPVPDFWLGRPAEYQGTTSADFKSDVILREGIDLHFDDCDFDNPETSQTFDEKLGPLAYKVIRVRHREPHNVHYE